MNKIIENSDNFNLFTTDILSINEKNLINIFFKKLKDYISNISHEN